jgi:hypothetical protein
LGSLSSACAGSQSCSGGVRPLFGVGSERRLSTKEDVKSHCRDESVSLYVCRNAGCVVRSLPRSKYVISLVTDTFCVSPNSEPKLTAHRALGIALRRFLLQLRNQHHLACNSDCSGRICLLGLAPGVREGGAVIAQDQAESWCNTVSQPTIPAAGLTGCPVGHGRAPRALVAPASPSMPNTPDSEKAGGSDATEARVLMKSHLSSQILYSRLWRFPFKPPALLGVIGYVVGLSVRRPPSRHGTGPETEHGRRYPTRA